MPEPITYPMLGKNGRLGNTLFQVATTAGTALREGRPWVIPDFPHSGRFPNLAAHIRPVAELPRGPEHHEPHFHYSPIPPGMSRLHGYFQSARYWAGHEAEVRELLAPAAVEYRHHAPYAAVHVRRGDYTKFADYHTNLPPEYYHEAIERLVGKGIELFRVYSDDPEWCWSQMSAWFGVRVVLDSSDPLHDFLEMIRADAVIMANSSFSWWGAYLNPRERPIIAPARWFEAKGPKNWQDIYCEGWVQL